MALIKQEDEEHSIGSDNWLAHWADSQEYIKLEDKKPSLTIKKEFDKGECDSAQVRPEAQKRVTKPMQQQLLKEALKNATVSDMVADLCKYQCQKCHKIFNSRTDLCKHFKETGHAISYRTRINRYLIETVTHICQICSEKVLCDKKAITAHLAKKHSTNSLKEYSRKTNVKCKWGIKSAQQQSLKEALEHATISDTVADLCKYQCQECQHIFKSRLDLCNHFKETGHAISYWASINRYLIETVAYICQICSEKVLCDKRAITTHLTSRHNINSLKEYSSKTNINNEGSRTRNTRIANTEQNVTQKVGNQCDFYCPLCDYNSKSWNLMAIHAKSKHGGSKLPPVKLARSATFHKCRVCDKLVLCDSRILTRHFKTHQLTINAYKNMIGLPSTPEEIATKYQLELTSAIRNIPAVQHQTNFFLEPNALPDDQVTKDIGNLSFFKCPNCSLTNMSYNHLVNHNKKKHQVKHIPYSTRHAVEVRYHRCHLCARIVLCDNRIIGNHLSNSHKMKLSEYSNKYVLKNGNRIFSTLPEYQRSNMILRVHVEVNAGEKMSQADSNNGLILPSMLSSESEGSDE